MNSPRRLPADDLGRAAALTAERRAADLMAGAWRETFVHHTPAVAALRHSMTFRTRRDGLDPGTHR